MLIALLNEHGGDWVFTAPAETHGDGHPIRLHNVRLHPVHLPRPIARQHYEIVSIRLLHWLFHYLHETWLAPVFDGAASGAWASYELVNRTFAAKVAELVTGSDDEVVLVNDPHLMLVPGFITERAPRRTNHLVYFHGLPWCDPGYFRILPAWIRTAILNSMLSCDTIGFHARRWANAFLACCAELPDTVVHDNAILYRDRRTSVVVSPGPVDAERLITLRADPDTQQFAARLADQARGRRVIARADRLDLWKNLLRGFAAYELLLGRRPSLADDWWFCAVTTPPSLMTRRHRVYQRLCERAVERINDRFGHPERPAATLIYPGSPADSRLCVVAALGMSNTTLVNPTFDGLNLVAKEALVLADRAPLLLSVNAGAFEHLAPLVTSVEPFDLESTSAAMSSALDGTIGPTGAAEAGLRSLHNESPADWIDPLINGL
jgi:trehalose 6-phosphate synthase